MGNSNPKISIILVNYNGAADTLDCIKSLRLCSYSNFEIIVVDNCSTDDSYEILDGYREKIGFFLIQSGVNNGFSFGNNVGIRFALSNHTDYCLLLNNDTIVEEKFLEHLLSGFNYFSNCGMTIGKILYEKNRNIIWYGGGKLNTRTARTEHLNYNCSINNLTNESNKVVSFATGCCMLISRNCLEEVGLLDQDYFLYEEDADYCYRVCSHGYKIIYIPSAVIYHKVSSSTGAASRFSQYYLIRNKYLFIRKRFKGINKLIAYTYVSLQMLFRCIKNELGVSVFFSAFKSFLLREIGKTTKKL